MTLSHRGFLLASLFCAALACIVFLPGLPGGFVLDDIRNIVENTGLHLQSLQPSAVVEAAYSPQPGSTTRFIPMLTFALGTSAALIVVGLGSSAATMRIARWGTTVSAITVLIMGLILIGRGALAGPMTHHHLMHMM